LFRKIIPYVVCVLVFSAFAVVGFINNTADESAPKEKNTASVPNASPVEQRAEQAAEAGSHSADIEKYILKYEETENKVVLITLYTDKSHIISHIKSINPALLTAEDTMRLKEGIELFSKEEMYLLIEDYSS